MPYGDIDLQRSNTQEVFDYVINHLRQQGKQSTSKANGCEYRTDEGLACAVGCLIPNDKYESWIEGKPIDDLIWDYKHESGMIYHLSILKSLQQFHDTSTTWIDYTGSKPYAEFEAGAERLARRFNLVLAPRLPQ